MRLNEISEKSRLVLKALAKGLSYEQLLAADHTLTSHDVFRALSESPTGFWDNKSAAKTNGEHSDA
jgi:hypothetical protein